MSQMDASTVCPAAKGDTEWQNKRRAKRRFITHLAARARIIMHRPEVEQTILRSVVVNRRFHSEPDCECNGDLTLTDEWFTGQSARECPLRRSSQMCSGIFRKLVTTFGSNWRPDQR
jgi:hypothetical protein